jgi:hypothetical protein
MHQFPNQPLHPRCDIWETYTEVNLARLESSNIDRESFHGSKTKTVGESKEREQILRVLTSPDHFEDPQVELHTRVLRLLRLSSISSMATPHMASLYQELQRVFEARPTDLTKTGKLLTQLKVRAIESNRRSLMTSPGYFGLDWPGRSRVVPSTRDVKSPRPCCNS